MNLLQQPRAHLAPIGLTLACAMAVLLGGCSWLSRKPPPATPVTAAPQAIAPGSDMVSQAVTPFAYRRDAARHLYDHNMDRIYRGKMPPLLYAIGVLQVEVDSGGRVISTSWMRAPSHAPEVVKEIEHTVRAAAPYPAPVRMGRVTYTDTWLWHRSGTFQLDTLTEGQY